MVLCAMSSQTSPAILIKNKTKIVFLLLTIFIGMPIIMFLIIATKSLIAQASNAHPEDVVAVDITKSSTSITWVTSKKTQGVVEYGITPSNLTYYGPEVEAKHEHSVPLTLLTPSTTYYFRLNIDGSIYDNNGVPWTFTTKTKDGTDVIEAVKGISTKKFSEPEASKEAVINAIETANCVYTTCREIQAHLGKGCSASDYFKCISTSTTESEAMITSTPTPTPAIIMSNKCKMDFLQVSPGEDCTHWTWSSYETHREAECRGAFHQYVFQCSSKSFTSTNTDDEIKTYFDDTILNRKTTTAQLKHSPSEGSTVFCQIKVEDPEYNGSQWISADAVCNY